MVLREVSPLNNPFPSIDYCFKLHSKSTLGKDTGHIEGLDNSVSIYEWRTICGGEKETVN